MRNILIIGGLGFVGSHFIKHIAEKHPGAIIKNVDCMDCIQKQKTEQQLRLLCNYQLISEAMTSKMEFQRIFIHTYDAIIYFEQGEDSLAYSLNSNTLKIIRLLEALKKGKAKRFIRVSNSPIVSGKSFYKPQFIENVEKSRAFAHSFVQSFITTYQLSVIKIQGCTPFGENQGMENLIPKTIHQALLNEEIILSESEDQIREWIYVKDYCEAIYQVLIRGRTGECYSIGTEERKRNSEVVKNILNRLGKQDLMLMAYPFPSPIPKQKSYSPEYHKITKELGWKPKYTFGEALEKTISSYEVFVNRSLL